MTQPTTGKSMTDTAHAPRPADDRDFMGTAEEAKVKLINAGRDYRSYCQPVMGTSKQLREHDIRMREARNQLANAALLWLWHEENPA